MGRVTYEEMAPFWPSSSLPIAARMNALPKLVFSRTLVEPLTWNNSRLARGDLAEEITAFKREAGDPLRSIGSVKLVKQMMALGLVDRLRLVVFPRILGRAGRVPMFDGYGETSLALKSTSVVDSDILILEYRPLEPSHV